MGNSVAHSFEMFVMGRNLPILQDYGYSFAEMFLINTLGASRKSIRMARSVKRLLRVLRHPWWKGGFDGKW